MFRLLAQWFLVFASASGTLARSKALAEEVLENVYWQGYERGKKEAQSDSTTQTQESNRK